MAINSQIGIFNAPTGNIGCDIWESDDIATCGVKSYCEENKYPNDAGIGQSWIFALRDDVFAVEIAPSGVTMDKQESNSPRTLEYGTAVSYGSIRCDSSMEAMTCTNVKIGRGWESMIPMHSRPIDSTNCWML